MSGADIGGTLSLLATLTLLYEFLAIKSKRLPTISRVWQGLRDTHPYMAIATGIMAIGLCVGIAVFDLWLVVHLLTHARSSL